LKRTSLLYCSVSITDFSQSAIYSSTTKFIVSYLIYVMTW